MDALEVSVSRVIACLTKSLEACLHKSANAAAKNSLLTEEVGFGLGAERGLKKACSCTAYCKTVSKCHIKSLTGVILLNSYKARSTLACLIFASDGVTGSLGSYHCNIDKLRRLDASEMNVEAVSEHKHIALFKVRLDILLIHICLKLIVDKNHNNVGFFCSLGSGINLKALLLCLSP